MAQCIELSIMKPELPCQNDQGRDNGEIDGEGDNNLPQMSEGVYENVPDVVPPTHPRACISQSRQLVLSKVLVAVGVALAVILIILPGRVIIL